MNNDTKIMNEFAQFISSLDNVDNVIGIGFMPSQLKGVGTEYLVQNGVVTAKFYDGNLI